MLMDIALHNIVSLFECKILKQSKHRKIVPFGECFILLETSTGSQAFFQVHKACHTAQSGHETEDCSNHVLVTCLNYMVG